MFWLRGVSLYMYLDLGYCKMYTDNLIEQPVLSVSIGKLVTYVRYCVEFTTILDDTKNGQ